MLKNKWFVLVLIFLNLWILFLISSGFNDLIFKLILIKLMLFIIGVDDEVIMGFNEVLGFDGYGKFENIFFGDYCFEEVKVLIGF